MGKQIHDSLVELEKFLDYCKHIENANKHFDDLKKSIFLLKEDDRALSGFRILQEGAR